MRGIPGEVVLGRYRLEHPIGSGGFGRVFLARQVSLGRDVALKASHESQRDDPTSRERFRREALLVAGISHPNVVTYHDFGVDDDDDMVLVMEFLNAIGLSEIIRRRKPLPLKAVARLVEQAAAGLGEAHARGIVHRDVKPSNLLVLRGPGEPRLKVIDFGILRPDPRAGSSLPGLTRSDVFIGTPAYAAPEMLLGPAGVDARADQYALALVAYELISGERAFPARLDDDDSFSKRLEAFPGDLTFAASGRAVPPGVGAALGRALAPRPDDRFPTIVQFAAALSDAVDATPRLAEEDRTRSAAGAMDAAREAGTRVDTPTRVDAPGKGRLRVALVAAAVVLAAAGAAVGWLVAGTRTAAPVPVVEPPARATVESQEPPARAPANAPVPVSASVPVPVPEPSPVAMPAPVTPAATAAGVSPPRPSRAIPAAREGAPVAATGSATLTLNARPWAEVTLDGRPLGKTPVVGLAVAPGRHQVVFTHPTLGTEAMTPVLKDGEAVTLSARFPRAPPSASGSPR
jgi:serine/threonine-protein kinase